MQTIIAADEEAERIDAEARAVEEAAIAAELMDTPCGRACQEWPARNYNRNNRYKDCLPTDYSVADPVSCCINWVCQHHENNPHTCHSEPNYAWPLCPGGVGVQDCGGPCRLNYHYHPPGNPDGIKWWESNCSLGDSPSYCPGWIGADCRYYDYKDPQPPVGVVYRHPQLNEGQPVSYAALYGVGPRDVRTFDYCPAPPSPPPSPSPPPLPWPTNGECAACHSQCVNADEYGFGDCCTYSYCCPNPSENKAGCLKDVNYGYGGACIGKC